MTARWLEYVPLTELQPNPLNPKRHDLAGIGDSMGRLGYLEPVTLDERTGQLVSGHGRVETLARARAAGADAPEGVRVEAGRWLVPVNRGWASRDDAEALAAVVALNRYVERGGWDAAQLVDLLEQLEGAPGGLMGVGFDAADLSDLVAGRDPLEPSSPPVAPGPVSCPRCGYEEEAADAV